jgi:cell division septal protein FtsQ
MRNRSNGIKLVYPAPERRPRRRKLLRGFLSLLLAAAFFYALYWGQALCRVTEIKVNGLKKLDRAALVEACGIKTGTSLLLLCPAKVEAALREHPGVSAVAVKKQYWSTVLIEITEREPAACIFTDGVYWVVDGQGTIIEKWFYLQESLPVITGVEDGNFIPGLPPAEAGLLESLRQFLSARKAVPQLELSELNLADRFNQVLYTAGGLKVLLGDGAGMEQKLQLVWRSLPFTGTEPGLTLDVSTGDRAIIVDFGKAGEEVLPEN